MYMALMKFDLLIWYTQPCIFLSLDFSASCSLKVELPNMVTYLIQTPIFELHVVWCGYKNEYKKDMCLKEIGLHA